MVFENSLHYKTFADRSQVENRIESYDSLIIPSKLMVGGKKAVPPLVYRLVDAGEVSYYVNPSIREFHRGDSFMDGDELKAWHQKLTEELGEPLYSIIDSSFNLSVEELPSEDIREIAQSVVEFQENVVMDAVSESMDKYEQALADNIRPRAIVPWYQKISDYEHINQNREILEYSQLTDLPIKPCIHAEVDFLRDATARAQIIEMLSINENKECFVWIDGLKKSDTSVDEYIDVLRFI